ncbi:hypothetical protein A2U01_0060617, partial [Trifolium medium]|nr:hypothetical protein [Trifolium medium]
MSKLLVSDALTGGVNLHLLAEFLVEIIYSERSKVGNFSLRGDRDARKSSPENILGQRLGKFPP